MFQVAMNLSRGTSSWEPTRQERGSRWIKYLKSLSRMRQLENKIFNFSSQTFCMSKSWIRIEQELPKQEPLKTTESKIILIIAIIKSGQNENKHDRLIFPGQFSHPSSGEEEASRAASEIKGNIRLHIANNSAGRCALKYHFKHFKQVHCKDDILRAPFQLMLDLNQRHILSCLFFICCLQSF